MRRARTPFRVEAVLSHQGVLRHLDKLVTAGCKRNELLAFLSMATFADDCWKKLVGTGLRNYRRNIREIENCANLIERLNRSKLLWLLTRATGHADARFAEIHRSPTLPEQLRKYADNLSCLPEVYGPKRKLARHAWKAFIVANVIEVTGTPHDPEVSALIAAVLDDDRYGEKAHQAWRLKHAELIKKIRDPYAGSRLPRPPSD